MNCKASFVDSLRHASINFHTSRQLARNLSGKKPSTLSGFAKYTAETREIHRVLNRKFPVKPKDDFVQALDTDLWFLELEAWHADLPMITQEPYPSEYARYLNTLPKHTLGCHWYNLVFAHLAGGNRVIAEAVQPILPEGWIASSEFFQIASRTMSLEAEALREAFDAEAHSWTSKERRQCLEETPTVFRHATKLNGLLFE